MSPKQKAFCFNFISFAILFILIRIVLAYFFELSSLVLALISAVFATVFGPRFGVVKTAKGQKVMMNWIFRKGVKEI